MLWQARCWVCLINMKSRSSDIIKVFFATVVALCLLFAMVRVMRGRSELRADSAIELAQLSLEIEREYLAKEAKQLGPNISTEVINWRWKMLKSEIIEEGVSPREAAGILSGVAKAKCPTLIDNNASPPPRMWPICARVGWIKNKKVHIVYAAYWRSPLLVCGNSSKELIQSMSLSYRVYVISANEPFQCWIPPLHLQALPQEEQGAYISDDESLRQYNERQTADN